MKRGYDDVGSVDISLHSKVCLKFFEVVPVPTSSGDSTCVQEAVSTIYQDSAVMINTLLQSNSFALCHVASAEYSSTASTASATMLIRDLVLLTSFLCSYAHELQMQQKSTSSSSSSSSYKDLNRRYTGSPLSVLIALAPYWAIAALSSQSKVDQNSTELTKTALKTLLSSRTTSRAHIEIVDEVLNCTTQLSSSWTKNPVAVQIVSHLRRALRTHLKNVLLFAVIFSVSMHTELTSTLHKPSLKLPQAAIDHLLATSDDKCIDVVKTVVNTVPQLALVADTGSIGATPLAYAASYRSLNSADAEELQYKLSLGLCKVLTDAASSALAIADRLGMLPLHHAARKGHSTVVDYISSHFSFTVPLRDSSGKAALHHALMNSRQLNSQTILHLAAMYPRILKDPSLQTAFDPVEFARRNCAESIYVGLLELSASFSGKAGGEMKVSAVSPSGSVASANTDLELSESELSHEEEEEEEDGESDYDHRVNRKSTSIMSKDQDLLQYADTLLMLHAASATALDEEDNPSNKRRKLY